MRTEKSVDMLAIWRFISFFPLLGRRKVARKMSGNAVYAQEMMAWGDPELLFAFFAKREPEFVWVMRVKNDCSSVFKMP